MPESANLPLAGYFGLPCITAVGEVQGLPVNATPGVTLGGGYPADTPAHWDLTCQHLHLEVNRV